MFTNRFYKLSAVIICGVLILTTLLCIIVSFSMRHTASYFNANYSILLCLVCLPLALLVSKIGNDWTLKLAKQHVPKRKVIMFSVLAHLIECLLVITPLFVCLLVNGVTNDSVFNWLVVLLGTLVYPISAGVVMVIILKTDKKHKHNQKATHHA